MLETDTVCHDSRCAAYTISCPKCIQNYKFNVYCKG